MRNLVVFVFLLALIGGLLAAVNLYDVQAQGISLGVEYEIFTAPREKLVSIVEAQTKAGWQLQGGVSVHRNLNGRLIYSQAMWRDKNNHLMGE
jgi:hypothetical protein